MSLRLLDRNREVFQYVSQADFARGGEFEVVWQVKPEQFQLCWGGDANRVFDMPGSVLGFAFDFAGGAPASSLTLLALDIDTEAPPVRELPGDKALLPLYRFDRDELFRQRGGQGLIVQQPDGVLLKDIKGEFIITERRNELLPLRDRPAALILDAEVRQGELTAFAILRDAKGVPFTTPELRLQREGAPLQFDLGAILEEAVLPVKMDNIFFRNSAAANGEVLLKSAALRTVLPAAEALELEVETGTPVHVLRKGGEAAPALRFTNRSEKREISRSTSFTRISTGPG